MLTTPQLSYEAREALISIIRGHLERYERTGCIEDVLLSWGDTVGDDFLRSYVSDVLEIPLNRLSLLDLKEGPFQPDMSNSMLRDSSLTSCNDYYYSGGPFQFDFFQLGSKDLKIKVGYDLCIALFEYFPYPQKEDYINLAEARRSKSQPDFSPFGDSLDDPPLCEFLLSDPSRYQSSEGSLAVGLAFHRFRDLLNVNPLTDLLTLYRVVLPSLGVCEWANLRYRDCLITDLFDCDLPPLPSFESVMPWLPEVELLGESNRVLENTNHCEIGDLIYTFQYRNKELGALKMHWKDRVLLE